MNGVPRHVTEAALIALVAAVATACGTPPPDTPAALIVIASATATERRPAATAAISGLVAAAAAHDAATLEIVLDRPDGPEPVVTLDLVPRRGSAVERAAERRDRLVEEKIGEVDARLGALRGDSGRIDVMGMLAYIARIPGPATAVVVTSGLQSEGSLAVGALGWDLVGSAGLLDRAAAEGLLPDLTGKTIVFAGLGDVAAPQQRLPERLRARLAEMWLAVCARAGAVACSVDPEVVGGSPVSTVPAPTVPVPPDPVLALPVATEPAVTELPSDVLFEPDSAQLLPDGERLLRELAAQLPVGATVELTGRTATIGSAASSRAFSLERARSCQAVLIAAGVPASQVAAVGLGYERQIVPDVGPDGRLIPEAAARNRSVMLTITGGAP